MAHCSGAAALLPRLALEYPHPTLQSMATERPIDRHSQLASTVNVDADRVKDMSEGLIVPKSSLKESIRVDLAIS
ncbi:MAG: hypothetical protein R3C01_08490 [Planctomycetaceae bacterium]